MSKLDKLLEKERNKYSQELFGKNESELQIAEILKLDQYIYDLRFLPEPNDRPLPADCHRHIHSADRPHIAPHILSYN